MATSAVPVLMVLYSNDGVEVRYNDKTRLQISPCGSTLTHFDNPDAGTHPLYGTTKVQQRVRFVTSNHRHKVLQALDFRNRFSERPYLCRELTPKTEITALYTNIKEVKWPLSLHRAQVETLPDGSIRVMATDDFASLVLSPHGRDFTVCYLSKVSEEIKKAKTTFSPTVVRAKTDFHNLSKNNELDFSDSPKVDFLRAATPPLQDFTINNGSSPEFKIDPIYTQRVSTPTKHKTVSINETPIVTPYGVTAMFKHPNKEHSPGSNVHELSSISKISSEGLNGTIDTVDISLVPGDHKKATKATHNEPRHHPNSSDNNNSNSSNQSCEEDSSVRYSYVWVTRHYSCSQCPMIWSHPLKLATKVLENPDVLKNRKEVESIPSPNTKPKKEDVVKSCLPLPQPLTCPFQHLHRWSTGHGEEFQSGRLSVVMADGVIYRLVYLPSTTSIEMYPGDGSVIYSHGISGQYYQHLLFKQGKLEERSYSLKSLPPPLPNSPYSLEKLVKRGSRFLSEAFEADKHTRREELPCWKHEESKPMEPISCEILEECCVPGRGKFSAYTNGRIRVVFDDRTALDMVCDFSNRLDECLQHSEKPSTANVMPRVTGFDRLMGRESCRLLLPNGQYILVDITKPGIYNKYVTAAIEWAKWVNSLPKDRGHFYQDMEESNKQPYCVAAELKKINCFNYIIDNTVLNQNSNSSISLDHHNIPESAFRGNQASLYGSRDSGYTTQYSSSYASRNNYSAMDIQRACQAKDMEIFNGFNSVRQALLKTSKLINDIDHMLEKPN
ncbi:uncharacterized protein C5orf34 homolog [Patella vulgata]|uniref:uncharacterized protein C5orf34 homolog n=1 Tax=Patella vulgata TaxID=6465 RepID=UPI0024A939BF|nr:uncharacterized protein C5orf34 homolog [Patella vulgata]